MNRRRKNIARPRRLLTALLAVCITASTLLLVRSDAAAMPGASGVIQFRIERIRCLEQTVDLWGDDNIALGGTVASKFGIDVIEYADLGSFDDDGSGRDSVPSDVRYDNWVFAEIPIEDVVDYTRVQLSLVEVDLGGNGAYLAKLAEQGYECSCRTRPWPGPMRTSPSTPRAGS